MSHRHFSDGSMGMVVLEFWFLDTKEPGSQERLTRWLWKQHKNEEYHNLLKDSRSQNMGDKTAPQNVKTRGLVWLAKTNVLYLIFPSGGCAQLLVPARSEEFPLSDYWMDRLPLSSPGSRLQSGNIVKDFWRKFKSACSSSRKPVSAGWDYSRSINEGQREGT